MIRSEHETILLLICAIQVLHETLDELEGTSFYKQSFKQAVKRFESELTRVGDPMIKKVLQQDEDVFNLIMEGISSVSKELATLDPAVIAKVALLIEQTKNQQNNEVLSIIDSNDRIANDKSPDS